MHSFLLLTLSIQLFTEPGMISGIESADLNHDGWIDLITQNSRGYSIHLNRKSLRFELSQRIERIGIGEPGGIALADINHDGHLDLISGSHDSYRIAILLGDGNGRFNPASQSPLIPKRNGKPHNHRLAVADLNGDSHPDIVSANITDGNLTIMLGDGKAGFTPSPQSPLPIGPGAYAIRIADLNRDGLRDLVVASTHDSGPDLLVALGRGDGSFTRVDSGVSRKKFRAANLELTDWNGDGILDAIVGPCEDDHPCLLLGNGKGGFDKSESVASGQGRTWRFAIVGNRIVSAANNAVEVASPKSLTRIPVPSGTWNLVIADLDHDGKPDIASVSTEMGSVQFDRLP